MLKKTILLLSFITLLSVSFVKGQDVGKAWKSVFKNCSSADIMGDNILFFGPSNKIGLGSVWRKNSSGGYNPRLELSSLIKDENEQNKIIKPGEKTATCTGGKSTKWNLSTRQ